MSISTHILDTARGAPARAVPVRLDIHDGAAWQLVGSGETNADGRVGELVTERAFVTGTYRIRFDIGPYFEAQGTPGFYPYAEIVFTVTSAEQHYHVPLLLSPFGYSTYRGS